jgi:hypothetical protein
MIHSPKRKIPAPLGAFRGYGQRTGAAAPRERTLSDAAARTAEVRATLRRADRIDAAVDRLQPLATRLEDDLREARRDASMRGENNRVNLIDHKLDELFYVLDALARG